jgi:hypothetical protein
VSIRARRARTLPLTRLGAPAVVVAAALSLGAAQGPLPTAQRTLADSRPLVGPTTMQPFAATPRTYPFASVVVSTHHSTTPAPLIPAPAVTLPTTLDASAAAIPRRALAAYVNAATLTDAADPSCRLSWQMLAGIGFVESDNAIDGGSGDPHWNGVADPPIYGPMLDGTHGLARVRDTDLGMIDGSASWDRAVGPMQIMPATWARYAADGNHDGVRNPQDIDDASLTAGHYLCAITPHLNRPTHLVRAIYGYNHSYSYVREVLSAIAHYLSINPATLGSNRLPKPHRHAKSRGVLAPAPVLLAMPSPSPTSTSVPLPVPTPSRSWAPGPSPTPHLPGR